MIRLTKRPERGAALVEMAFVIPLFVLMIFGMIEAGWAFAQANDVRHGAREAARMAAVSDEDDVATIVAEVCDRMDLSGTPGTTITLTPVAVNTTGDGGRNAEAQVLVELDYSSLTGAIDFAFAGLVIRSDIDFRVEQPIKGNAAWWTDANAGVALACT
jgi:Flp pilus assembly protein TadG